MTEKKISKQLRQWGLTLRKTDGEYRVCFKGAPESSAYYTHNLIDAFQTARAMLEARHARTLTAETYSRILDN